MMHLQISRDWLFSRLAQRIYLACALLDLALIGTRIGIVTAMSAAGVRILPPGLASLLKLLLFPEVLGTAVLLVGMSYCWLGINASYKKKLLWILFLGLFPITMPIYYFSIYRQLAAREVGRASTNTPIPA
jgi:hypothetical protein